MALIQNLLAIAGLLFDLTGAIIVVGPGLERIRSVGLSWFNWLPWFDWDHPTIERGFTKIQEENGPITSESDGFETLVTYLTMGPPRNYGSDAEPDERFGSDAEPPIRYDLLDEEREDQIKKDVERIDRENRKEKEKIQDVGRDVQNVMASVRRSIESSRKKISLMMWRRYLFYFVKTARDHPELMEEQENVSVEDIQIRLSEDHSEIVVDPAVSLLETKNFDRTYYEDRVERDIERSFLQSGVFLFIIGFVFQIIAQIIGII